jgi:glyoxylase-like metal-dependent hydrolase (beta-lactamase superfamily II)
MRNFAYLIGDDVTKGAAVVDPSFDPAKILAIAKQHDLTIKYLINTHDHYDHVDGNDYILANTKAELLQPKDGEEINLGTVKLKIIATPGHSDDSICILVDRHKLITGDTLFVGSVGRVWSKDGAKAQVKSLQKLMQLPEETEVYPGHDYGDRPVSTIEIEKQTNPYIQCL